MMVWRRCSESKSGFKTSGLLWKGTSDNLVGVSWVLARYTMSDGVRRTEPLVKESN